MCNYIFNTFSLLLLTIGLHAQCNITATSSGGNPSYTQVYVLVDANTDLIVAENTSGSFPSVNPGSYRVHALNYNPADAPAPLPSALIGQDISLVGSSTAGCFNADFLTDYINRSCSSCQQSNSICESDPLIVSSSGGNGSYAQLYVLVDAATDLIVSTSTAGNFTGTIAAGNSYKIYALNYNAADAPSPLPIAGQSVNSIGRTNRGCYNEDYLTDYICYNVTSCSSPCFRSSSHCLGDDIVVNTSGENEAYTQIFVLADNSGNFIAENSTGVFPTNSLTSGASYRVHALNYNASNPPAPLPSALNPGDPISSISGGCYNADFLTDYLCFIMDCTLLEQELVNFNGRVLDQGNQLRWTINQEEDLLEMLLERSPNGMNQFQILSTQLPQAELSYQYLDTEALKAGYYRLRLKYSDGLELYSQSIYLERSSPTAIDFKVYPNPTNDILNIELNHNLEGPLDIKILDNLGRVLLQKSLQTDTSLISLNCADLVPGSYILSIGQKNWLVYKNNTSLKILV